MHTESREIPVVALGASAGGVNALATVVRGLPVDLPAAVLVVLHVSAAGPSLLPSILSRSGCLPASHAVDGEIVNAGHIYIAPPDQHLELEDGTLRVTRSPKENGVRPSVDTLFRSVARTRHANAIAVVLSGTLDDGTSGLIEIRRAGGHTVVQDPAEADFPGMPANALRVAHPEYVAALDDLAALVTQLVNDLQSRPPVAAAAVGLDAAVEADVRSGPPSRYTCPECGGTLFEAENGDLLQFRCRVGHGYTGDSLLTAQHPHLESAMYAALVALEERADLNRRMARRMEQLGRADRAKGYWQEADAMEHQASIIRDAVARLRGDDR